MIAARLQDEDGSLAIMLVLEPGNIEKLKNGEPIHKWLNEFIPELRQKVELLFCYTPDAVWVAEQMKVKGARGDAINLAEVIEQSLSRKPVVVRDKSAEEMKRLM
jgi:hypothetical protein